MYNVHNLVTFLVQTFSGTLAGEYQHRGSVHVRISNPGNQVGCSGAKGAETARSVTGKPAVNLGHKSRTLFMPRKHKPDFLRLFQRHHEIGIFLSGNTENILNTLGFESVYKQV